MACKHVIPGTGKPGYRGFEVCPYCGAIALMFTKFQEVKDDDMKRPGEYTELPDTDKTMRSVKIGPAVEYERIVSADMNLEAIYLGLLTAGDAKPLSRIEYDINLDVIGELIEQRLVVQKINQFARNGNMVEILVLSKSWRAIIEVRKLFDGKKLNLEPETVQNWGRILGYPSCCVDFFVNEKTRHSPNGFQQVEQSLLFHWACPNCEETKKVIPVYREIWNSAKFLYKNL